MGKYTKAITVPKGDEGMRDPVVKAWYDDLRANNPTKRVYDIDPYVEVYRFEPNLYGLMTDMLDVAGGIVWMWLIIGPEKAMLIDTSFGLGNLKGLVNEITGGMPLIVANTHCGPDHSYGNCQFDECYSHQLLYNDMMYKQDEGIRDYLVDDDGVPIWAEFDVKDFCKFKKYKVHPVYDGYIFDLGQGYEIELINLPGHQPGHSGYLDKQGRFLIGGDSFPGGGLSGGMDGSKEERHKRDKFQHYWLPSEDSMRKCTCFRDALYRLKKRIGDFDKIYCGHGIQGLDSSIVLDLIDTSNKIIADPSAYDSKEGDCYYMNVGNTGYKMRYYENGI